MYCDLLCPNESLYYRASEPLISVALIRLYESVSKSFRTTGRLERELQMVELSATRCNCMA